MPSVPRRVRVERGLYRVGSVYYACATPAGARNAVWRSLGAVGVIEARRRRDEFVAEVRRAAVPVRVATVRFEDVAAEWLEDQRGRVAAGDLRPRTYDIYELALRLHVVPELGARQIRSLTADELVDWRRRRQAEGYSADATRAWWTPLRLVLAHGVRRGLLDSSPADKLLAHERPKAGESRKRFLTRDEMERLLACAPERYRLALATGLFSGVRLGELLGLIWEDIDLAVGVIHVHAQLDRGGHRQSLKTAAGRRDVILMPRLASLLRERRAASTWSRGDNLVFAAASGRTVGHRNLAARGLGPACEHAGLGGVTFHALRHTFASMLIAQGHDPVFVSRQLGHANPAITLRVYSHLFDAARHADQARQGLEAQFRDLLD